MGLPLIRRGQLTNVAALMPGAAAPAGITRIQADSTQSNFIPISTPVLGDLIVLMAHRDGSTTPPTKVAGFTTIDAPTGANANSAILAFKFSDGTETSSGTWLNATSIAYAVYRNAGLGGWAKTIGSGSSATMSYSTNSMAQGDGTSWTIGFGASVTASDVGTNAPSGMTLRTGIARDIAIFDTGAGVASWSVQTAGVNASAGWITYTLELLAVPAGQLLWTLIQHSPPLSFASATTAVVTLTQAVGSEPHVLVVSTQYSAFPSQVVSIDKGGTLIPVDATLGASGNSEGGSFGYCINSTTATSPITVTYAGATNGNVSIWEWAYTGTGTPAIDFANRIEDNNGTTSENGPGFTLSGGNDIIIHTLSDSGGNVTAITNPYNSPTGFSVFPGGNGFAAAANRTSAAAPTWTLSASGFCGGSAIGFGLNPTAFQTFTYSDFEAATGTTATVANLTATTRGWTGGIWSITGTAPKFESGATRGLTNAIARLNDGSSAPAGAGATGLRYLTTNGQANLVYNYATGTTTDFKNSNSCSAAIWFNSNMLASDVSVIDMFVVYGAQATNYCNCKLTGSGATRRFSNESPGTSDSSFVSYVSGTWVRIVIQLNRTGSNIIKIYDASLTLLGTLTETGGGSGTLGKILIGPSTAVAPTPGFNLDYDSLLVDPTGSMTTIL